MQEPITTSNAVNVSERLVENTKNTTVLNAYDVALVTESLDALVSFEDTLTEVLRIIYLPINFVME